MSSLTLGKQTRDASVVAHVAECVEQLALLAGPLAQECDQALDLVDH